MDCGRLITQEERMTTVGTLPKDRLRGTRDFAEWLNAELYRRRMTQNELEACLHSSGGVVSKWSRGITAPSPRLLFAIAELWDVDVDWLLTLTGYRPTVDHSGDVQNPRANLLQLVREIELTPERVGLITAMLENMRMMDGQPELAAAS
jgi:transcriptional regulator with XRE-family HTH domain